jgi:TonB family protein
MSSQKLVATLQRAVCIVAAAAVGFAGGAPKKVTMTEAMGAVVTKVAPEYPALAKQLKIAGAVELDVVIAENGSVEAVTPISGNPVLTKPAAEALRKWKFKPFQEDGAPVKAQAAMKINFSN